MQYLGTCTSLQNMLVGIRMKTTIASADKGNEQEAFMGKVGLIRQKREKDVT